MRVNLPARVGRIGMVARWKPVHLGHAAVLDALVARGELALIGVGSSNRYDAENPFTPDETEAMIRRVLAGRENYRLLRIPDLDDGPGWRAMVADLLGPLDLFVTANPYVRDLLGVVYAVAHPVQLLATERHVAVSGTMVRRAMAQGDAWRPLVPPAVAAYIEEHGLDERFRREFGAATLAPGPRPPVD